MNKLKIIIVSIVIIIALIFTGCSQSDEETIPKPSATIEQTNVEKNDSLEIDTALIKEAEANYSFEEPFVALDPYGNAPLSAVIIFTTPEVMGVEVKVLGHETSYDINTQFDSETRHVLPIYGLYAGEENEVLLTLDNGATNKIKITTEKIEEPYNKAVVTKKEESKMMDGLTFVSLAQKSAHDLVAAAYDNNGDIRWALRSDVSAWDLYRLKNGRLLVSTGEQLSPPYYTTGVREIDLMGKAYVEYVFPGGYHHSAVELPNDNLLVAVQDEDAETVEDVVFEIDRNSGNIVKTFDLKELLPMDDGASLSSKPEDWFHNNSVWYDDKSNSIILSGRNADAVVSIDYETGDLRWILGNPQGWTKVDKRYFFEPVGENFEWQYAQHAAMTTPEGDIFLFDNGVFRAKKTNEENKLSGDETYSRGVIYKIDEENMTIQQIFQYGKERGPKWYSFYVGDVDYLSKNHYLVNSGGQLYDTETNSHEVPFGKMMSPETRKSASIVEIKSDKVIFELITDFNVFAAERMNISEHSGFELYAEGKILRSSN